MTILTSTIVMALSLSAVNQDKGPPSKLVAWKLGSQLNLAMALTHRSSDPEVTKSVYAKAQKIAAFAGVEIPPLPGKMELPALLGVINKANKAISDKLATKYDRTHANLYDMASMSMVLLLVYELEDAALNKKFSDGIAGLGKSTGVPENLWQPYVKVVTGKGTFAELRSAALKMDDAVAASFNK